MLIKLTKAQSILAYVFLMVLVTGGFFALQDYLKRSMRAKLEAIDKEGLYTSYPRGITFENMATERDLDRFYRKDEG